LLEKGDLDPAWAGRGSLPPGGPERVLWNPRSRTGDRAPARGVDVKEPSRRRPDPGSRSPGSGAPPEGSPLPGYPLGPQGARFPDPGPGSPRIPDPGSRIPRDLAEVSEGLPRPRGRAPEGLFYINPSRRGPVPGPGPPSRPGSKDPAACWGRVSPQGCLDVVKSVRGWYWVIFLSCFLVMRAPLTSC